MAAMPVIVIEQHEWQELIGILNVHLPGRKVWAFGSRVTGLRVRRFSDLDLAIEGNPLTARAAYELEEALDESRLPVKVDLVWLDSARPEFRARIEPDFVLIQS